jgi:hypothetical protein
LCWILWDRVSCTICLDCLWTAILLISASWVARIISMSPGTWLHLLEIYSQVGLVGEMKFSNFSTWIILLLCRLDTDCDLSWSRAFFSVSSPLFLYSNSFFLILPTYMLRNVNRIWVLSKVTKNEKKKTKQTQKPLIL